MDGIGRCVPYLIQAAKLLLAAALGDYRPEVSLEPSKLSLSSNLFSPEKLLMTGDDYLFRFKLALFFYEAYSVSMNTKVASQMPTLFHYFDVIPAPRYNDLISQKR